MTLRPALLAALAAPFALASPICAPARADTLADALAAAYATNPDLAAQRAVVRQFDEGVPQALAGARPQATPQASLVNTLGPSFQDEGRLLNAGVTISQPIFTGGRVRAGVNAGEERILAARARLRLVENQVLIGVVTAYADVLRQQRFVELSQGNLRVLETNLRASRDRFEVGDLTRTDVAQSEARLENARSQLIIAQGNLVSAQQAYERAVGRPPVDLQPIPPLPPLPATADVALASARESSPALIAARFDEEAARFDVRAIRGELLPTVGAQVGFNYQRAFGLPQGVFFQSGFNPSAGVSVSIPLLTGGQIGSRARQAQARQSQLLEVIGSTERQVTENVNNAYTQIGVARAVRQSAEVAISANALALEGTRRENEVGSRTVLEVLNAEQELLQAQVNLVDADRNLVVAAYSLLATIGRAEAVALGAPVEAYDVEANARRVRGRWTDWASEPDPRRTPERNRARATPQPSAILQAPPGALTAAPALAPGQRATQPQPRQ